MKNKVLIFSISLFLVIVAILLGCLYSRKGHQDLPEVVLVLDDWGYSLNNITLLRSLDIPITLAVLPNLTYSREISEEAKFENREVILHMPMEPNDKAVKLEKDTIITSMSEEEIRSITNNALGSIENAKGISNHMGSKFTKDTKAMSVLLKLIKDKNLFFLDSVSVKGSVSDDIASGLGIKLIKRDVYLDNLSDVDYIKGQFKQLIQIAKVRGRAIGTGHDRKNTLIAIKESIKGLGEEVKFVLISELGSR